MAYHPVGRRWVKLWVEEWLQGSSRFELTIEQRAIFIDLLALAGRSRVPGTVCSGLTDDGKPRPYPLSWLAGNMVCAEAMLVTALERCAQTGKLTFELQPWDGSQCCLISLTNWQRYQSEYDRQKKYRVRVTPQVTPTAPTKLHPQLRKRLPVEGEGDVEEDVDKTAAPSPLAKRNQSQYPTFSEVKADTKLLEALKRRYPNLDLDYELDRCEEWWRSSGKAFKSAKLALQNWLAKASEIAKQALPAHNNGRIPEGLAR